MLQGLINIVAPPVGALLVAVLPTHNILMIDVWTAMLGITPLLFIAIPQPRKHHAEAPKASFMQDFVGGFKYMAAWPGLLMPGLMAILLNFLLAPTSALTPLLVTKYIGKGALELGSLDSFMGLGMIAGGVSLSVWGGFKKQIVTSLIGIFSFSIAILAITNASTDKLWIMIAVMALIGFMLPMANGPFRCYFKLWWNPTYRDGSCHWSAV